MIPILEKALTVLGLRPKVDEAPKPIDPIPAEGASDVASYVNDLWVDAGDAENAHYGNTDHIRHTAPDSQAKFTPKTWRQHCESLAFGENWKVWGHRPETWQQERVDGEIPRQMYVRKSHITANYHEFTITPNIDNINPIFDYERKRMGWKDWVGQYVSGIETYGSAVNEVTVDYTLHPNGQVRNIVRKVGVDIRRTPEAKSFLKSDGCNYVILLDTVTDKQVFEDFPTVELSGLKTIRDFENGKKFADYKHTKLYPKFRLFIDDETTEEIPFDDQQQAELADEQTRLLNGEVIPARKDQHHLAHIQAKAQVVDTLMRATPETDAEAADIQTMMNAHLDNIAEHLQYTRDDDLAARGMRRKYPDGRYICVIGEKVVSDAPNPHKVAWRSLFRETFNRRVEGRNDGAGDPEIMFHEAFQADIQLSRIEELGLLGAPQVWRSIEDKADDRIDTKDDNNPRKTKYYSKVAPTTITSQAPTAFLKLYELAHGKSSRDTGVNETAFGATPPAGTSGDQVALVQAQNRVIVTGELDANLREALEDIIEADLMVMRATYQDEREYVINGRYVPLVLAQVLSAVKTPEGQQVEVNKIEVTVKPGSNYPNQFETKLSLLENVAGQVQDPAQKVAMGEAILDHVGTEYPEFAEGGKYRVVAQATQIGMQVLQQQQIEQQAALAEQKRQTDVLSRVASQFEKEQLAGGGNGTRQ